MRRQVALLAGLSAAAPAFLLAAALLPVVVPRSAPASRVPIYIALGVLAAAGVARSILLSRLAATERAIVRFWAFAPMLTLLTASVLGALPVLVLGLLHIQVGRAWLITLAAALAVAGALVVWILWLRLRDSLDQGAPKREA